MLSAWIPYDHISDAARHYCTQILLPIKISKNTCHFCEVAAARRAFSMGMERKDASGYGKTDISKQPKPSRRAWAPAGALSSQKAAGSQRLERLQQPAKLGAGPSWSPAPQQGLCRPKNGGDRHQNAKYSTAWAKQSLGAGKQRHCGGKKLRDGSRASGREPRAHPGWLWQWQGQGTVHNLGWDGRG